IFRVVDRAFCEMTGYARAEVEGASYRIIARSDDLGGGEKELQQVRAGGEPQARRDTRFVHKSGAEIWVRVNSSLVRDANGAARYIISAIVDLSDSKQTEEELQRHLHFTRAMLDAIPSPVYFKDRTVSYPVFNR